MQTLSSMQQSSCLLCHYLTPPRVTERLPGTWLFPTKSYLPAKYMHYPSNGQAHWTWRDTHKSLWIHSSFIRKQTQTDGWGTCHVIVWWHRNNSSKSISRWEPQLGCQAWADVLTAAAILGWPENNKPSQIRKTVYMTGANPLNKCLILQKVLMTSVWILLQC